MATADATFTFGTSQAVTSRSEEFEFINQDWLADQENRFVADAIAGSKRTVNNSGQASAYGDDFGWDSQYDDGSGIRPLGGPAPIAGPLSRRVYYHDPMPYGRSVGMDKDDPNVRSEGSPEAAALARSRATYARCLQLQDAFWTTLLFGATTPWEKADVAAGTAWSTTTANIASQVAAALDDLDDPEDVDSVALSWSHWQEFLANTAIVGQYGGNVGAGRLREDLARQAWASMGIENVFIYRNRWGVLGNFVNLFAHSAVTEVRIAKPDSDARGISVRSRMPSNAFDEVEEWYAHKTFDGFVDVPFGIRLSGA